MSFFNFFYSKCLILPDTHIIIFLKKRIQFDYTNILEFGRKNQFVFLDAV